MLPREFRIRRGLYYAQRFSTKLETRLCNRAEAIFCGICRTLTMRSDTTTNQ